MTPKSAHEILFSAFGQISEVEPNWARVRSAIFSGHIDLSKPLLRSDAFDFALCSLVAAGPSTLFMECVRKGMPLRPKGIHRHYPLFASIEDGRPENLAHLLKAHPLKAWIGPRRALTPDPMDAWTSGARPAFRKSSWKQTLKLLVDAGCDVNRPDPMGRSPLLQCLIVHLDAMLGVYYRVDPKHSDPKTEYRDRALLLIAAGADVNQRSQNEFYEEGGWPIGATPLFARPYGDGRVHRALLKAGANPLVECLSPIPWNAIEFAEMHLERLGKRAGTYVHPRTGKRIRLKAGTVPDDPDNVRAVIAMMRRAAKKLHRKT